jgi:hypothetical protein
LQLMKPGMRRRRKSCSLCSLEYATGASPPTIG